MNRLYAPWRTEYINQGETAGCFLCLPARMTPAAQQRALILQRGRDAFVIVNRYPYNNGHLMIVPNRHVGNIEELTAAEYSELFATLQQAVGILRRVLHPDGFNVGMNLGRVAGAGLAEHIHIHVVPRWNGDTNFMPVFGQTKVISEAFQKTYARLRPEFRNLKQVRAVSRRP